MLNGVFASHFNDPTFYTNATDAEYNRFDSRDISLCVFGAFLERSTFSQVVHWSGGAEVRPRHANFLREQWVPLGRSVLCLSVCLSVRAESRICQQKSRTFAPETSSGPPAGLRFASFCTKSSWAEQFCSRCVHRFWNCCISVGFGARAAVPRNRNFACRMGQKRSNGGAPSWRERQCRLAAQGLPSLRYAPREGATLAPPDDSAVPETFRAVEWPPSEHNERAWGMRLTRKRSGSHTGNAIS